MMKSPSDPNSTVIVWDLETVPDLDAVCRLHGRERLQDEEAEALLGDKFPKLPLHKIACIGALIAQRGRDGWTVRSLGAPHIGQRTEAEIIDAFVQRVQSLQARLVSFNGHGFDLPVLRYRAMINFVGAAGLDQRAYFNRYTEDALDLCDVLSSYDARSKMTLDGLCRVLSLPGKPDGIDGSQVARYYKEGRLEEVANYCETDVVNTYRVWLRYELFRGRLSETDFAASEENLRSHLTAKLATHPHLSGLIETIPSALSLSQQSGLMPG